MKPFRDTGRATFLAGNGNPDKKPVGPPSNKPVRSVGKSIGDASGAGGGRVGGGNFNDNVVLDTSQVERGKSLREVALQRRIANNRGTSKGNY